MHNFIKQIFPYLLLLLLSISSVIAQGSRVSLLETFKDESMKLPSDIAIISDNKVLIADGVNSRLVLVTMGNQTPKYVQFPAFKRPLGICSDDAGGAWITDTEIPALFHIDANLQLVKMLYLSPDINPTDVLYDQNFLFVVDNSSHSILKVNLAGEIVSQFGSKGDGRGQMSYPAMIAKDSQSLLYITDVMNARVVIFDVNGKYLGRLGSYGVTENKLYRPKGICVSDQGYVYVSDSYLNRVICYDAKGVGQILHGSSYNNMTFDNPLGVAVLGESIFVLESFNATLRHLDIEIR
jgi:outer membrane protein assembly factor BamB